MGESESWDGEWEILRKGRRRIRRKMEKRMEKANQRKLTAMRWKKKSRKRNLVKTKIRGRRLSNRKKQRRPPERHRNLPKNKQEKPRGKIRLRKMKKSPGRRGTRTVTTPRISKEERSPSQSRRPEAHCQALPP